MSPRARLALSCVVLAVLAVPAAAPARTFEYLGSFGGSGSNDGQFVEPADAIIAADGTILVTDAGRNRITRFSYTGALLGGFGNAGSGNGQFNQPRGVAQLGADLYVVDSGNARIQRLTATGAYVSQWGSPGAGNGQFSGPQGIATDDSWLYVADKDNNRVQKFSGGGGYVRQWSSSAVTDLASNGAVVHTIGNSGGVVDASVFGDPLPTLFSEIFTTGALAHDARSGATLVLVRPLSSGPWVLRRFWDGGAIVDDSPLYGPAAITDPSIAPTGLASDCRGTVLVVDRSGDRVERWGDPNAPPPPCGTPASSLSATSLALGQQRASTVGPPSTVSVLATGDGIDVSRVTVSGPDADAFLLARDGCTGATSWPGAPCGVSVRFAPTRTGAAAATLTLVDATTSTTYAVALSGTGTAEPAVGPGPAGPPGPAGKTGKAAAATASCAVKGRGAKRSVSCTARPASARVSVSLMRGKTVFASGSGKGRLNLKLRRPLGKGRYTVKVSSLTTSTGSPLTVR